MGIRVFGLTGGLAGAPADRVLHALPMTGTWGGLCIPLSTFSHGACLVVMDTFDAAVALHLIEREGITIWNAVDAMAIAVLDHPDLARRKRSTLRTGGFGMTGGGRDGLFEDVLRTLGVPEAYQPYGMTELNALSMLHDLDESDESRALPGVWAPEGLEVRVVDPETGELVLVSEVQVGRRSFVPDAVGALVPPGWTRTYLPGEVKADGPLLPQWAYTAAGWDAGSRR